jgi:hypothetical protein
MSADIRIGKRRKDRAVRRARRRSGDAFRKQSIGLRRLPERRRASVIVNAPDWQEVLDFLAQTGYEITEPES